MTADETLARAAAAIGRAEDILLSVDEESAVKYAAAEANGFLDLASRWLRAAWSALPDGHPDREDLILAERAAAGTLTSHDLRRVHEFPALAARAWKLRRDSRDYQRCA